MFWLKVNHPAHAGACRAVHQRVCPFEYFNAIDHLGIHHLTRQHAGQAAKGHVIAVKLQATNTEGFGAVTVTLNKLHARIVGNHISNGFRLLIFHQLRGVAGDIKRHVHGILLAEHPQTAAVCHLSIQEGGYQLVAAGSEIRPGGRLDDHGVFWLCLCRKGTVGHCANGERQQCFMHSGVVHNGLIKCARKNGPLSGLRKVYV